MNESVDDLSVTYFEDGVETVKQLDKIVLTKRCMGNDNLSLSRLGCQKTSI